MGKGEYILDKKASPKAYGEAHLTKEIPRLMGVDAEAKLKGYGSELADAYHQVAAELGYQRSCNMASAVGAYFLKRRGYKARVMSFLYLGENPNTQGDYRGDFAELAQSIGDLNLSMRTSDLRGTGIQKIMDEMYQSQGHHANLIPRKNEDGRGRFAFLDLTYSQFQRDGFMQDPVFDIVNAAKLRRKYLLVPLASFESKKESVSAAHNVSGEAYDPLEALLPSDLDDLLKLQTLNPQRFADIIAGMDQTLEKNKKRAGDAQKIISQMKKRLKT